MKTPSCLCHSERLASRNSSPRYFLRSSLTFINMLQVESADCHGNSRQRGRAGVYASSRKGPPCVYGIGVFAVNAEPAALWEGVPHLRQPARRSRQRHLESKQPQSFGRASRPCPRDGSVRAQVDGANTIWELWKGGRGGGRCLPVVVVVGGACHID